MAKAAPHSSRNPLLAGNVNQFSRSQSNSRAGVWAKKSRKAVAKKAVAAKPTIKKATSRFYATEDKTRPMPSRKSATTSAVKLRSTITPGTVLILLAGRYKGSRVVFLKQLNSGLLLVTGPYAINGVPLRRVNQAYVIATSTKIDISSVTVGDNINDAYFAKAKKAASKKTEQEFFEEGKEKKVIDASRKTDQKSIDSKLIPLIKKTDFLKPYLASHFSLSKAQYPHELKF